jgi:DNA helicase II / ATP-dependent DNA helicase PcrA
MAEIDVAAIGTTGASGWVARGPDSAAKMGKPIPQLNGDALKAVTHRGSHLQIIAAAGSGKTEVVSQRVADLLADGVSPRGVVAFTFTERAARELKQRITERVHDRLGPVAVDALCELFVGTIHAYCFRLLQRHVPRFETYDVLDDNQLTALLSREAIRLEIRQFDDRNRLFASIKAFRQSIDVVENELLDVETLPDPFGSVYRKYLAMLDNYRLLTYGQQVRRAVEAVADPKLAAAVQGELKHLIVDEYQDVNPAQEKLIELLAGPGVEVCVVGDDLQAIYQWRGSDVSNIVTFADRYSGVEQYSIVANRRSRPQVVDVANRVASTITGGIPKQMQPHRLSASPVPEVVLWNEADEMSEAGRIAYFADALHDRGVAYRDVAVLVRSRAAYQALVAQFATFGIPVQPGGRTGLFDQPEARTLGRMYTWLADTEWRDAFGPGAKVADKALLDELGQVFVLDAAAKKSVGSALRAMRDLVPKENRTANLVGEFYEMLGYLGVAAWRVDDPIRLNAIGTLARFSALLADYESVRRRARPDDAVQGEQVGGQDRGTWYYRNLALHIVNYAQGAYEGFDGEPDVEMDAVDVSTVHAAKGLEWPVVFLPSMTATRFPSKYTGNEQTWLLPRTMFPAHRYEGSDNDERRLFYVATTRARDWLSVSRHERVSKNKSKPSPYYDELVDLEMPVDSIAFPPIEGSRSSDETLALSFSELAQFLDCPMAYRLRTRIGFQPRLAAELGYGKAVHHMMRSVAECTKESGRVPSAAEIDSLLDSSFFLPTANKVAHRQLKDAARRLVQTYAVDHADELHRVWETERPFELHLDGITVSGRADVILDQEGGVTTGLAIVDYKTSTKPADDHGLQLQVYTNAGRREGLDVRGAYVHDLKSGIPHAVEVTPQSIVESEAIVLSAADRLRRHDFTPCPGARCRGCEVRTVCGVAK